MSTRALAALAGGLLAGLALLLPGAAAGDDLQRSRAVAGMDVHLGVMAAEEIRARHITAAEERMHGGIPAGDDMYHVLVTLFDRASGARIEDASVRARVAPLGLGGPQRDLETMYSAGLVCYCAYFEMTPGEAYRIDVEIDRPQLARARRTHFVYTPE